MTTSTSNHLGEVEAAMIAIRRRQGRRALARQGESAGHPVNIAGQAVLDAVEAAGQSGHRASVSSIGMALDVDQPRASRLVAGAVDSGLVRRDADQGDGRRSALLLTESGRAQLAHVHELRRSAFDRAMSGFSDEERATFADLLTRFVSALNSQAGR